MAGIPDGNAGTRAALIERNLRLVNEAVNRLGPAASGEDIDELFSAGTVGLIKAVDTYQTFQSGGDGAAGKAGVDLSDLAARRIEEEIFMYLRSRWRFRHSHG